jgi:hypothetical protein
MMEQQQETQIIYNHIPKILHQMWFQGEQKMPDKYKPYQQHWKELHPDFKYMFWDEASIIELFQSPKYIFAYPTWKKLPAMIQKIDMARYAILAEYGGIYADLDMDPIKPIHNLVLKYQFIASKYYLDHFQKGLSKATGLHYMHKHRINSAIFGTYANHQAMIRALHVCVSNVKKYPVKPKSMFFEVFEAITCGPEVLNQIVDELLENDPTSVKVYPEAYFEPPTTYRSAKYVSGQALEPEITAETHVVHRNDRTWVKQEKKIGAEQLGDVVYVLLFVVFIFLAISIVYFVGKKWSKSKQAPLCNNLIDGQLEKTTTTLSIPTPLVFNDKQ